MSPLDYTGLIVPVVTVVGSAVIAPYVQGWLALRASRASSAERRESVWMSTQQRMLKDAEARIQHAEGEEERLRSELEAARLLVYSLRERLAAYRLQVIQLRLLVHDLQTTSKQPLATFQPLPPISSDMGEPTKEL